jgi:hypothetical protein
MLTIEQAFIILANLVRKGKAAYHKDYDRTVDVADMMYKLITGDGATTLLTNFTPRESKGQLQQRINITQLTTKPLAGSIMQPFYRPGRLDNIKRLVAYDEQTAGADVRAKELEQYIAAFWGNESVEEYLAQRVPGLSFLDPNAARPAPIRKSSAAATPLTLPINIMSYSILLSSSLLRM